MGSSGSGLAQSLLLTSKNIGTQLNTKRCYMNINKQDKEGKEDQEDKEDKEDKEGKEDSNKDNSEGSDEELVYT